MRKTWQPMKRGETGGSQVDDKQDTTRGTNQKLNKCMQWSSATLEQWILAARVKVPMQR